MNKNNILQKSESALGAKKIYIEDMSFHRKAVANGIVRMTKSSIGKSIKAVDENEYKCSLTFKMSDEEDNTSLNVTISGVFEFKGDLDPDLKEVIITKNTMAILFPYLRSQITLLTAQPDIEPVVLPPININALLKNMEN